MSAKDRRARRVLDAEELPPGDYVMTARRILQYVPLSPASWWEGVKSGRYEQPVWISPRVPVWRSGYIRELLKNGIK